MALINKDYFLRICSNNTSNLADCRMNIIFNRLLKVVISIMFK